MIKDERRKKIIEILEEKQSVTTEELSEKFSVSKMTVRRDLNELEKDFQLQRTHGGAIIKPARSNRLLTKKNTFTRRLKKNKIEKEKIARKATELVNEGETIFLDPSTTSYYFAQELKEMSNFTVITNSPIITTEFMGNPSIQVVCLGGNLRHSTGTFVGPETEEFLLKLHADKLFISAKGININYGITEEYSDEAQVKRSKMQASSTVVLISDYSKFGNIALVKVAPIERVKYVVTDDKTPEKYIKGLKEKGIEPLVAS